jgi:hypothetical protein
MIIAAKMREKKKKEEKKKGTQAEIQIVWFFFLNEY